MVAAARSKSSWALNYPKFKALPCPKPKKRLPHQKKIIEEAKKKKDKDENDVVVVLKAPMSTMSAAVGRAMIQCKSIMTKGMGLRE